MKTCPVCKASFDEDKCERKLVYKKKVIYCPNCGTELVKQPPFIAIVLLCLLYACIKHLFYVDGLIFILLVLSIVLSVTAPYKEYGKKSKIVTPIDIVIFVIIVLLGIFVSLMDTL